MLFYEGVKALYHVASGILQLAIPIFHSIDDPFEIVAAVQGYPRSLWNCQELNEVSLSMVFFLSYPCQRDSSVLSISGVLESSE